MKERSTALACNAFFWNLILKLSYPTSALAWISTTMAKSSDVSEDRFEKIKKMEWNNCFKPLGLVWCNHCVVKLILISLYTSALLAVLLWIFGKESSFILKHSRRFYIVPPPEPVADTRSKVLWCGNICQASCILSPLMLYVMKHEMMLDD